MSEVKKKEKVMRSISVPFSDAEMVQMGKQIAEAMGQIESIQSELDEKKTHYKNRIQVKEAEITKLKNQLSSGFRMEEKLCELVINIPEQRREYWVDDKMVDSEPAQARDFQTQLDLAEASNAEEDKRIAQLEAKNEGEDISVINLSTEKQEGSLQFKDDAIKEKKERANKKENDERIARLAEKKATAKAAKNKTSKDDEVNHVEFAKLMGEGNLAFLHRKYGASMRMYEKAVKLKPEDEHAKLALEKSIRWVDQLIANGVYKSREEAD